MKIWIVVLVIKGVIAEVDVFMDEESAWERYHQYESEMDTQDDTLSVFEKELIVLGID